MNEEMAKKHKKHKKRALKLSFRVKVILAVALAVIVAMGLLILVVAIMNQKQPSTEPNITESQKARRDARVKQAQRDGVILDTAKKAIEQGDPTKAQEVYKTAIDSETDTARKVSLSLDQAGLLYDVGKVDDAIKIAKQAEVLSDDKFLVADWLSRLYEDQRQYGVAAQYYTLAGQWAKSLTNKTAQKKSYYDSQAARVSALVKKS